MLESWGILLTGYLDGSYTYQDNDTIRQNYNTFALQQASFTLARQPTLGFGALVQVIAGEDPHVASGFGSSRPGQGASTTGFYLLQAFAQYVTGLLTLQGGKFSTLAGAEYAAPVDNTNTTRSIDGSYRGSSQKLDEVTLTLGYDPSRNFEFRVEGRCDDPDKVFGVQLVPKTYQG
jgi:hypothetical protein